MKITRRQLRRIIREAIDPRELEEPVGGWVGNALTNDPDYANPLADYKEWVKRKGHITPASSSVMATYFIENGMTDDHDVHELLANEMGISHEDVMREISHQEDEYQYAAGRPWEHN